MMIDPPKIEYVQATEKEAVAEAVSDAISEERDVVVVFASSNLTESIVTNSENSTITTAINDT
jgi:hypothetical protein